MLKRNKKFFIFFILYFTISFLSFTESQFYSINKLISYLKLKPVYYSAKGEIQLRRDGRLVKILINSPYIQLGVKYLFAGEFIKIESGQVFIPVPAAKEIVKYLSPENYKYFINNGVVKYKQDNQLKKIVQKQNNNSNKKDTVVKKNSNEKKTVTKKNQVAVNRKIEKFKINAIIIDPGHGGKDPGTAKYNINEKDVVLRTALILENKLKEKFSSKKILLTRKSDVFIPLEERAEFANDILKKYGTSLFISIHVNASVSPKPYGFETWYIIDEYRKQIIKKGEISNDRDVEYVLNSMLNEEIYIESKYLAKKIQDNLEEKIGDVSRNRGIKENTYIVIKKPIMPATLVEIGFVSNKYEANRLTKYAYLSKIADGITNGITEFIKEYEESNGFTK